MFELGTLDRASGSDWSLFASARYQHYTRLNYFGSGVDARLEDETTYLGRDALFELNAGYQGRQRLPEHLTESPPHQAELPTFPRHFPLPRHVPATECRG